MTTKEAKAELSHLQKTLYVLDKQEALIAKLENQRTRLLTSTTDVETQFKNLYNKYLKTLLHTYAELASVETALMSVGQPFRNVLTLVYTDGKNLEAVSETLGYSYAYISKQHAEGLRLYAAARAQNRL